MVRFGRLNAGLTGSSKVRRFAERIESHPSLCQVGHALATVLRTLTYGWRMPLADSECQCRAIMLRRAAEPSHASDGPSRLRLAEPMVQVTVAMTWPCGHTAIGVTFLPSPSRVGPRRRRASAARAATGASGLHCHP